MNRIDRLFGILLFLQSKKYVSAEKIADKFNISIRTVYRDIKALCEQGVPVNFEQHKGYCIMQGYFLSPVSFSSEEANALLLMERLVAGFADQSIQTHYSNALNKIKAILRHQQKEKLEWLESNIRMQLPSCINNNYQYLSLLQQAITLQKIVHIEYENSNKVVSSRRIEPIGLIFYAFSWHVIAWCHLREAYRDFKLSRIVKMHCLEIAFTKPAHISLDEYMQLLPVDY
ncbi:YafY family transcriptional regulator [Ilyomonas limi]|uniref:YafY family transcriptional regulator n=1 Tax=Ilyomonas limi TaxID=2575867 RepID=A0A4U3KYL0_9BACT|nr:YafY family protein [Ilyomonas limi]TKK67708.1 YafY family transcriptional regulator [Ilyomonas limi]